MKGLHFGRPDELKVSAISVFLMVHQTFMHRDILCMEITRASGFSTQFKDPYCAGSEDAWSYHV